MEELRKRPSWDEYFLKLAEVVATRSPCLKRQVGAVIVNPRTKNILSTGYNGPVRDAPHCETCARKDRTPGWDYDKCPSIHAELNAIISAAKNGIWIDGTKMYLTTMPCYHCAKAIINAGIRIVAVPDISNANPTVINYLEKNGVYVTIGGKNVYFR